MNNSDKEVKPWIIASYISGAGILLVIYILSGYFLSRWLVHHYGGSAVWIALGTILGLVLGIVNIIVLIYKFMGEQNG
ncbi:AtpZ/AtpI family protein [Fontibacillus sp. BL9]|uniref:AtpZ/AtpI family protein n=1 Tax=Fontibacillus sp. BL9 TaxID=3389971 RepID=UPI00397B14CF